MAAKTTLQPWLKEEILVDIESTEPLTKEEEEVVTYGIRIAFSWCDDGEPWPSLSEIKQAISKRDPTLASKLISRDYLH